MTITPQQCAAARMLGEVDLDLLSAKSMVPLAVIRDFEAGIAELDADAIAALRLSLEAFGIEFLAEERGRGVGLRLKFGRRLTEALSSWEGEGGDAGEDKLP